MKTKKAEQNTMWIVVVVIICLIMLGVLSYLIYEHIIKRSSAFDDIGNNLEERSENPFQDPFQQQNEPQNAAQHITIQLLTG